MPKHVLVALPLSDAQRSALQASVPEHEFIFAQTETVTLAQVLEADIIMGNVPVELICQNHHLEWFQSNFAGPDTYLVPGVLPEQCLVTNATGAYGLAISEWMLGLWLGLQKDLFLYRDRPDAAQVGCHHPPGAAGGRVPRVMRWHGGYRL